MELQQVRKKGSKKKALVKKEKVIGDGSIAEKEVSKKSSKEKKSSVKKTSRMMKKDQKENIVKGMEDEKEVEQTGSEMDTTEKGKADTLALIMKLMTEVDRDSGQEEELATKIDEEGKNPEVIKKLTERKPDESYQHSYDMVSTDKFLNTKSKDLKKSKTKKNKTSENAVEAKEPVKSDINTEGTLSEIKSTKDSPKEDKKNLI